MDMQVCAIFDVAAGVYSRPFFCGSKGLAVRMFQDEVGRDAADNPMFKHPQDFRLFYLGTFDDNSGVFNGVKVPELLFNGSDR